jgi:hypothetical protein
VQRKGRRRLSLIYFLPSIYNSDNSLFEKSLPVHAIYISFKMNALLNVARPIPDWLMEGMEACDGPWTLITLR